MSQKTFDQQCWEVLMKVPKGKVTTYQAIAHALGTRAYRAVGNAMHRSPGMEKNVPCHRCVKTNGELGGFAFGPENKETMLAEEGVPVVDGKVDLKKYMFQFR